MLLLKSLQRSCFTTARRELSAQVRVRFAPSPTGNLHIGGLRIAMYNYLFAKKNAGEFLLRIEDTDRDRFKPDAVENIVASLRWTGIEPDEGPGFSSNSKDSESYFQSNRLVHYQEYAERLLKTNQAYKCYCDEGRLELLRKTAVKNQEKQAYDGKCRHLTQKQLHENADKPFVVRFKLENRVVKFEDLIYGPCDYNLFEQEGDFVLIKSDGFPTYHFANIVDDHLMRITHVLRGQEWLSSTPKHLLLYEALSLQAPNYAHFPLILNKDGGKLSKRNNDIDVMSFKKRGFFAEALLSYLTTFGGGFGVDLNQTEAKTLPELVKLFDFKYVVKRSSKYNEENLVNVNKEVLKKKIQSESGIAELMEQMRTLLKTNLQNKNIDEYHLSDAYLKFVLNLTQSRVSRLNELLSEDYGYLWYNTEISALQSLVQSKFPSLDTQQLVSLINTLIEFIQSRTVIANDEASAKQLKADLGKDLKSLKSNSAKPLNLWLLYRLILCGNVNGPPVVDIICLLGRDNILYRLNNIKKSLK